jgi:hypothetical protein
MTQNGVKIEELLRMSPGMQLVVTAADLKEFALSVASEVINAGNGRREEEPHYSPREFAERHNVDKSTLWRWCKAGILTKRKEGGKVYYRESDLKIMEG